MGVGKGAVLLWILIHSTDKEEGGLMVVFLDLFFLSPPPGKFSVRHPWQYVLEFQKGHAQRHRKGGK